MVFGYVNLDFLWCCLVIYSVIVFQQGDFHFEAIAHCDVHYYLGKSDTGRFCLFLGI